MNFFTKFAVCTAIFAGAAIASAETVNFIQENAFYNPTKKPLTIADGQLKTKGRVMLYSKKAFDVDPSKKYTIKVTVSGNTVKPSNIFIGYYLLDNNLRSASAVNWQGIQDSFTQVARAAKKGDTVIYLKDASKWESHKYINFSLNAKEDNSDIPNRNIVKNTVASKAKNGDVWAVTLSEPLKVDLAAGTNVRQHVEGGYYYSLVRTVPVGKDVTYTATVQGRVAKAGKFNGREWPFGVAKVHFLILIDWNNTGAELTFKEMSLTIE